MLKFLKFAIVFSLSSILIPSGLYRSWPSAYRNIRISKVDLGFQIAARLCLPTLLSCSQTSALALTSPPEIARIPAPGTSALLTGNAKKYGWAIDLVPLDDSKLVRHRRFCAIDIFKVGSDSSRRGGGCTTSKKGTQNWAACSLISANRLYSRPWLSGPKS